MVFLKHLVRCAHLGAVSFVLNSKRAAHCVGGTNQSTSVPLPTSFPLLPPVPLPTSFPLLPPLPTASNARFLFGRSGKGMFGSRAVSQAIPPSQVALPSMSSFAFLPAFIAPASAAAGSVHVAPASAIDLAANSDAAVFAEFPSPLVQSPAVVIMANTPPDSVTLSHGRFLELLAKATAYEKAQQKALQDTIKAAASSQPSPPKLMPEVSELTKECPFATLFPELDGDLKIFQPTNYRSRHCQSIPNWQQLQGYNFNALQKTWFAKQMKKDDPDLDYRAGDTREFFCKRYGIPFSTAKTWLQHYVSEQSYSRMPQRCSGDPSIRRFTMNHGRRGRPLKMGVVFQLSAFKEIEEGSAPASGGPKQKKSHLNDDEIHEIFKRYSFMKITLNPTSFVFVFLVFQSF